MHEALRKFITSEIMKDSDYDLQNDEELISGGLIDSFSLVELQLFIEREVGILIDDTDLTADAIDTVNDLAELIAQYQQRD